MNLFSKIVNNKTFSYQIAEIREYYGANIYPTVKPK